MAELTGLLTASRGHQPMVNPNRWDRLLHDNRQKNSKVRRELEAETLAAIRKNDLAG